MKWKIDVKSSARLKHWSPSCSLLWRFVSTTVAASYASLSHHNKIPCSFLSFFLEFWHNWWSFFFFFWLLRPVIPMFSFAFFFFFFLYKKIFALSLSKKRGKKALELRERNFLSLSVSGTNKGERVEKKSLESR